MALPVVYFAHHKQPCSMDEDDSVEIANRLKLRDYGQRRSDRIGARIAAIRKTRGCGAARLGQIEPPRRSLLAWLGIGS